LWKLLEQGIMDILNLMPMKKNIQIAVSKPCHEKWNSFTKTANGGFCSSCQKEVIDFTSWSDERIRSYFKNLPRNTCGQFRSQQLKVYEYDNAVATRSGWIATFFAAALVIFSSRQVAAQQSPAKYPTEQYEVEKTIGEVSLAGLSSVSVRGVVKSQDDGTAMPGVNVALKGTSAATTTDADGHFELTVEDASSSPVLVFSFIGFQSLEDDVDVTKAEQLMEVNMVPEVMQLGGIVVGGAAAYRWYSPKRWWWKVRSVFVTR
jgi:hypothetical protein